MHKIRRRLRSSELQTEAFCVSVIFDVAPIKNADIGHHHPATGGG
jgi:hypothetical protein